MSDLMRQRLIRFCDGPLDGCELPFDPSTLPELRAIVFVTGGEYESSINAFRPRKDWIYTRQQWTSLFASCEAMWQAGLAGRSTATSPEVLIYRLSKHADVAEALKDDGVKIATFKATERKTPENESPAP